MQVQIEDVSPVEKKLIVEVPWDSVAGKLGASYKALSKQVNLKGFRKGKVPRSVLERMFGKRVQAEVASDLVRESFIEAVSKHQLEAVSEPRVDSELIITKGKPFSFEAIVEVKGEVVAKDYKGLELTKRPIKIDEDELEHRLLHLRKDHMDLKPIEGRTELTTKDQVTVALKGKLGEHDVDQPEMTLDLSDDHHEPLPGLHAAIVGLPIDAVEHEISLTIPEDFQDESIAGAEATFAVTVTDAREQELPDFDDEFAKDTGRAETAAELREQIAQELRDRQEEQVKGELNQAAIDALVAKNDIPVAQSLVERVIENRFRRLQMMMGMRPGQGGLDAETREHLSEGAADEVRAQLLLEAVAEQEKLEVGDDEIDARVAELAAQMGGKNAGQLKAEMARDGRLENIEFSLRQDKAIALLIDNATVTEKEPEPEVDGAEAGDPEDQPDP
jgi:trigger factor